MEEALTTAEVCEITGPSCDEGANVEASSDDVIATDDQLLT